MLTLTPVALATANAFVNAHHRHHKATAGHKFSIGCAKDGELVGVAIVGRPVSRYLRKTGYEVMQSYVMHKPANDPIFTFIEKKRGEGKSGKLAMVAGLNKFFRVYYGKVTELYRSLPAIE